MREFGFKLMAENDGATGRAFRIGFNAEIEAVESWRLGSFGEAIPGSGAGFITIPSGPVLITSVGPAPGNTVEIAESSNPRHIAQWIMRWAPFPEPQELTIRTIVIPGGTLYKKVHTFAESFIGLRLIGAGTFLVEAIGRPDRAPASFVSGPVLIVEGM